MKTTFYFRHKDIKEIAAVMKKTKKADTPFQERRAIAYAIALIEKQVGAKLGIKDRAGMEFGGTGDPTQQDCVDEATNTTSYLLVLQSNGLLKYHTVTVPMTKGDLLKAYTAGRSGEILAALDRGDPGEEDRAEVMPSIPGSTPMARTPRWSRSRRLVHQGYQ